MGSLQGDWILQFFNISSTITAIHPTFLCEWHPDLHQTIVQWIATGPNGSVEPFRGHFALYHDISVSQIYLYKPVHVLISHTLSAGGNAS